MADIPGLIEGASEGVGLGHEFLRHIERTRVLIHMVDAASTEGRDPVEDILTINRELEQYNEEIARRPQVIAANKIDCFYGDDRDTALQRLKETFEPKGIRVMPISAVTGEGVKDLLYHCKNGLFVVEGPRIERMLGYTNLDSEKGFEFFQKFMKTNGILDELEAMGIEEGDTVKMYGWQFDYYK